MFGFSTTTLLLSLYNVQVQGINIPNAVLGFALTYGGLAQFLAGLWEFASGNTFGATVFCSFGMFWWGYAVLLIPFFGFMGTYDGQPGIYAQGSPYAAEADNAIGLFLWIWFGITTIYLVSLFSLENLFLKKKKTTSDARDDGSRNTHDVWLEASSLLIHVCCLLCRCCCRSHPHEARSRCLS